MNMNTICRTHAHFSSPTHICIYSANEGHLYPLEKQFIFIHKPAVLIRFDEIESVEFQRYAGGQGSTRNFDLCVTLLNTPGDNLAVKEYTFSGIDKTNYAALYSFLSGKKIRIKNIEGVGAEVQPARGAPMYDEMDGGEEMGESSDDESYDQGKQAAGEESSGSDSEDEDDDDLGSVVSDDSDLAEHRKKSGTAPVPKKSKEKRKVKESADDDTGKGKSSSKIPSKITSKTPSKTPSKIPSKKRKESTTPAKKEPAASSKKKTKKKKDPNAPKNARSGE